MKYLDSGLRTPSQALGQWLEEVLHDRDVIEVRWQSGFYTADGLGFLASTLERIRGEGGTVVALLGSNNGDTLRVDVERLLILLGIPGSGALLGIVSFASSDLILSNQRSQLAAAALSAAMTVAAVAAVTLALVVRSTRADGGPEQQPSGPHHWTER